FNYDEANDIQNAEGYTENCGTICVGVSDRHIRKLLDDPNICMVIPYHKSGLNPIVAHMNKIAQFVDYTGVQNTRYADGGKVDKDFDFNKALHKMGENGDPKAVAEQYLAWCDDNGYLPKFDKFRDHPNYYKFLEDFTLFDKDGNYVPQREVRAVFPTDDSAFKSMKSLIKAGLEEDAIIQGKTDARLSKIVDEIEKTLPKTEELIDDVEIEQADRDIEADAEIKFSRRVSKKDLPLDDVRRYTQTTYDKYGWAYVCGALNSYSGQAFLKAINETVVGTRPAVYNRYGDLKIVVGSDENHFDDVLI
ncbi:hypothetical protein, partial [Candidatus Methanarcanum hacksteinii]|uniref:hypothetical protein n=1 Tax=Candidatus Methanarcanum hacksteinii TaxID=2911857 RepID=UPI0037DD48BD